MGRLTKRRVGLIPQCYLAKQLSFNLLPLFVLFFLNNRFESIDQIARSKLPDRHPSRRFSSICKNFFILLFLHFNYFFSSALLNTVYVLQ